MKTKIYLALALTVALVGAACQQTATVNTNSAMNQTANHNSMMSANSGNSNTTNPGGASMRENANVPTMSSDMMESAPNAASQPYDLQFIDTMIVHHQSAVTMAELALTNSNNAELKKFAQKIIDDQKKEINQMKEWREKWFAGKASAINVEMPGMMSSMKGMDMGKMKTSKDKDFDLMFLDTMTPHHQGAITMSQEAPQKAEHPEIKTLANQIIKEQEAEIKQMNDWKAKWMK